MSFLNLSQIRRFRSFSLRMFRLLYFYECNSTATKTTTGHARAQKNINFPCLCIHNNILYFSYGVNLNNSTMSVQLLNPPKSVNDSSSTTNFRIMDEVLLIFNIHFYHLFHFKFRPPISH